MPAEGDGCASTRQRGAAVARTAGQSPISASAPFSRSVTGREKLQIGVPQTGWASSWRLTHRQFPPKLPGEVNTHKFTKLPGCIAGYAMKCNGFVACKAGMRVITSCGPCCGVEPFLVTTKETSVRNARNISRSADTLAA